MSSAGLAAIVCCQERAESAGFLLNGVAGFGSGGAFPDFATIAWRFPAAKMADAPGKPAMRTLFPPSDPCGLAMARRTKQVQCYRRQAEGPTRRRAYTKRTQTVHVVQVTRACTLPFKRYQPHMPRVRNAYGNAGPVASRNNQESGALTPPIANGVPDDRAASPAAGLQIASPCRLQDGERQHCSQQIHRDHDAKHRDPAAGGFVHERRERPPED